MIDPLRALVAFLRHKIPCDVGFGQCEWRETDRGICNCGLSDALDALLSAPVGSPLPPDQDQESAARGGSVPGTPQGDLPRQPTGDSSTSAPDLEWAIARLRKNQAIAESNAGLYGVKLLKGHGYPDEVMCDAQDALAYRIVLAELADLQGRIANAFA